MLPLLLRLPGLLDPQCRHKQADRDWGDKRADCEQPQHRERTKSADDQPSEEAHTPSGVPQSDRDGPVGKKCANERNGDDEDDLSAVGLHQGLRNGAGIRRDCEGGRKQSHAEND